MIHQDVHNVMMDEGLYSNIVRLECIIPTQCIAVRLSHCYNMIYASLLLYCMILIHLGLTVSPADTHLHACKTNPLNLFDDSGGEVFVSLSDTMCLIFFVYN